jgi:hypothetical protein
VLRWQPAGELPAGDAGKGGGEAPHA